MRTKFTTRDRSFFITTIDTEDNRQIQVRFEAPVLYGNVGKSTFSTTDPLLIKAIKNSPLFGNTIFVMEEEADAVEQKEETPLTGIDYYKSLCDKSKQIIEVEGVNTITQANNYLQREFGEVFKSKKETQLKEEGARKFNIVFTNW